MSEIKKHDLVDVLWREYDYGGRVVRIEKPVAVFIGETTHRVVDSTGVVWCVPAPGFHGCVVRWKKVDGVEPVLW